MIPLIIQDQFYRPFRIFRGPLFHQPVTGQELFVCKPALRAYCSDVHTVPWVPFAFDDGSKCMAPDKVLVFLFSGHTLVVTDYLFVVSYLVNSVWCPVTNLFQSLKYSFCHYDTKLIWFDFFSKTGSSSSWFVLYFVINPCAPRQTFIIEKIMWQIGLKN